MISALGKVNFSDFSQYGKLIGTGKNNGIKVSERLDDARRLTSVKDGNLVKEVISSLNKGSHVTAINHATGETTDVRKCADRFVLRRTDKDGNKENLTRTRNNDGLTAIYEKFVKKDGGERLELRVSQSDYGSGKKVKIESDTEVDIAGQKIPSEGDHTFFVKDNNVSRMFGTSEKLDLNLAEVIINAFSKLLS